MHYSVDLPEDVLKEILFHADADSIKAYCLTSHKICNDINFWKDLFLRDDIDIVEPLINANDHRQYYQKYTSARKEAEAIITVTSGVNNPVDLFHLKEIYMSSNFNNYLANKYNKNLKYTNNIIINTQYINKNTVYKLSFMQENIIMTRVEFLNFLTDILYFYPKINIYNTNGFILRKQDALKYINIKITEINAKKILAKYKEIGY